MPFKINPTNGKALRGFAALSPERRQEVARLGGHSVPAHKRSFAKDHDLASSAGRKGGAASFGPRAPKGE